jgi:hypothetical protein
LSLAQPSTACTKADYQVPTIAEAITTVLWTWAFRPPLNGTTLRVEQVTRLLG